MLQYSWTVLAQGFKNSPNIFGKILEKYLKNILLKLEIFLQYVDELLKGSNTYGKLLDIIIVLNYQQKEDMKYQFTKC